MIRKLFVVFVSGLLVSIALLGSAWTLGGRQVLQREGHGWHIDFDGDEAKGPRATRTLAFDGGKPLTIDGPVQLRFTRGTRSEMTVEGPKPVVDRLHWENGRLTLKGRRSWGDDDVEVTITAPVLAGLELNGASDVELKGLDQPELSVDAHGAVDLDANGKVRKLVINSRGAGNIDLENVDAEDAVIDVAGVGNVDISASGSVDARIAGAGNISLHRRPRKLTSEISGVGSVDHDYPGSE